ncbi:MAG: ECF transporter S component [Oscillospiraceae bacterium]
MDTRSRILWITRTAIFIALLIAIQAVTQPLGQYVTGSLVNLILILSTLLGGLFSGVTVALLSPVFAFLLGIGPAMPPVVPVIMLGNLVLVLAWHFIAGKAEGKKMLAMYPVALVVGAVVKFLVLYLGIVQLVLPFILKLPEGPTAVLTASFSYPQLITAALGGLAACLIAPPLKRILTKSPAAPQ